MLEGDEKARLMKDFFKRENWLGPREQQRLAHHLFRDAPRGEDFEGSLAPPERHHRKHPDRIHPRRRGMTRHICCHTLVAIVNRFAS